jgi:aldose 1-epimerase
VESARRSASEAALTCAFHSADFPELRKEYPFPHELRLAWTLTEGDLLVRVMVRNTGEGRMPMGFGLHPYFSAPFFEDTPRSECLVTVPAAQYWELEDSLPTGKVRKARGAYDLRGGRPLEGMSFDDVFTGLGGGETRSVVDDRSKKVRLVIESGPEFREMVVFTPPGRNAIAIEPYTCTTDAVNLERGGVDAGLIVLDPGGEFTGSMKIFIEEY